MGIGAKLFCDNNKTKFYYDREYKLKYDNYSAGDKKMEDYEERLFDRELGLNKKESIRYLRELLSLIESIGDEDNNIGWIEGCILYVNTLEDNFKVYSLSDVDDEYYERDDYREIYEDKNIQELNDQWKEMFKGPPAK